MEMRKKFYAVNLGPIAPFSEYKLTTGSGKFLGKITKTSFSCLKNISITSSKNNSDFSIGFQHDMDERIGDFCEQRDAY